MKWQRNFALTRPTGPGSNTSRTLTTVKAGSRTIVFCNFVVIPRAHGRKKRNHRRRSYPQRGSMSRIFDALQKSKLEGTSFDFPLMSSSAAEEPLPAEMAQVMEAEANDFATND